MLKITLLYNQTNRGFSETWYANGTEPPVSLNTALKNICKQAISFRSNLTTLEWIRFSVIGSPGKVTSFRVSNQVSSDTVTGISADVVSTDGIWRVLGENSSRRAIYLRGLNDASVERNPTTGSFSPSASLLQGVDRYLRSVINAGWLLRQQKTPSNSAFVMRNVLTIDNSPISANDARVTFSDTLLGMQTPLLNVRFAGPSQGKSLPAFSRTSKVLRYSTIAPWYVDIPYAFPGGAAFAPYNMQITALDYNYQLLTDWDFQSFSSRKTGRPFGSLRGRLSPAR